MRSKKKHKCDYRRNGHSGRNFEGLNAILVPAVPEVGEKKRKPMRRWRHQLEMGRRRRFGGNTEAEMRRDASRPKGFGEAKEQSGLNDPMPCLMHHGHACYGYGPCVMGHTSWMIM